MLSNFFVRDLDSESLLEIFLVSAISAILGIRLYLHLTGYPQIGSGGLHIAHMLWGGLFMLIANLMTLTLINRDKYWLAALLGGLALELLLMSWENLLLKTIIIFLNQQFLLFMLFLS